MTQPLPRAALVPRFRVCQEWVPDDEFLDASVPIEADTAKRAAEVYVELYHAELDYRLEVEVRVLPAGEPLESIMVFDVSVASVPEATARERKGTPDAK